MTMVTSYQLAAKKCTDNVDVLTKGLWLWCLIISSWLSGTGVVINGSLLFVVLRLKSSFTSHKNFLVTLFVGQVVLTCFVAPFRISQIVRAAYSCEGIPLMNNFVQSLTLIPRVTNGIIAYDRFLSSSLYHKVSRKMKKGGHYHLLLFLPWVVAVVDMLAVVLGDIVDNVVSLTIALSLITCAMVCHLKLKKVNTVRVNDQLLKEQVQHRKHSDKLHFLCAYIIGVQYIFATYGILTLSCDCLLYTSPRPRDS